MREVGDPRVHTVPDMPWKSLRNRHEGETGIVIANGPSLLDVPTGFLDQYPTIGCNHMGCACEDSYYSPTYWDQLGLNQVKTEEQREHYYPAIEQAEAAFVNRFVEHKFPFDNVYGIISRGALGRELPQPHGNRTFSTDALDAVGIGFTQTYISFQIAYMLGFDTVLVVGLDNDYGDGPNRDHYYDVEDDGVIHLGSPYSNEEFQEGSDFMFFLARKAYEADGRRIINLTPESKAYSLERGDLEDWYDEEE